MSFSYEVLHIVFAALTSYPHTVWGLLPVFSFWTGDPQHPGYSKRALLEELWMHRMALNTILNTKNDAGEFVLQTNSINQQKPFAKWCAIMPAKVPLPSRALLPQVWTDGIHFRNTLLLELWET